MHNVCGGKVITSNLQERGKIKRSFTWLGSVCINSEKRQPLTETLTLRMLPVVSGIIVKTLVTVFHDIDKP